MIPGDTNSFRRHLIDRPDMHDDLFKAIQQLSPSHGRPRHMSEVTSDLFALRADKLDQMGNGQDRRVMRASAIGMLQANADYMDNETGGMPTVESKVLRSGKVSRTFMVTNFSGSREDTLPGMDTFGNEINMLWLFYSTF